MSTRSRNRKQGVETDAVGQAIAATQGQEKRTEARIALPRENETDPERIALVNVPSPLEATDVLVIEMALLEMYKMGVQQRIEADPRSRLLVPSRRLARA